ncbi:hypothetical protein [Curtobacterium sp. RRHDQ10]|uniref:hypothetical protein n=1 Tax=Curtobacterium phyllosphaerae TaxID=3413379 RepID=UPI003BF15193
MPIEDDPVSGPSEDRARLEAVAYGAGSSPADAAAARAALAGLQARRGAVPLATPATPPVPAPAPGPPAAGSQTATSSAPAAPGLPSTVRSSLLTRVRRHRLLVPGVLLATALVAFGAGTAVGAVREAAGDAAASSGGSAKDDADGALTISQLLAMPQTFADQLPGAIVAPVVLHSTRLVYSNKSLSADDSQTPWDVYAARGNDAGTICLIATADGLTSSQSCFPARDVLSGTVSLVAQARSGILAVRVDSGVVRGRVAPNA